MKRIFLTLFSILISTTFLNAQNKLSDVNRLVLSADIPEHTKPIPLEAKEILVNKLTQIASNNGMGGESLNHRFTISARFSVMSKDIVKGPPELLSYNFELTISVNDNIDKTSFSSTTVELIGVGTNETKAYIDAISNLNVKNKKITATLIEGKNKIIDLYNSNCDFIIKEAESYSKKGEYDRAMYKLALVPDVCEKCYVSCMDRMNDIYQQKVDKECLLIMREANTTWLANPNSDGAEKVAEILNKISPFSTCEPDAGNLMRKIENKLAAVEKAKWDFKMKKYTDAIKLKEQAISADAEENKRQAYLKKEAQKQDYALKKADQEAGGIRGFVNSIVKLKMSLWRENTADTIYNN